MPPGNQAGGPPAAQSHRRGHCSHLALAVIRTRQHGRSTADGHGTPCLVWAGSACGRLVSHSSECLACAKSPSASLSLRVRRSSWMPCALCVSICRLPSIWTSEGHIPLAASSAECVWVDAERVWPSPTDFGAPSSELRSHSCLLVSWSFCPPISLQTQAHGWCRPCGRPVCRSA